MVRIRFFLFLSLLFPQFLLGSGEDKAFKNLLEDIWQINLKNSPELAFTLGHDEYAGKWTDNSLTAIKKREKQQRDLLNRLNEISMKELSEDQHINYKILRHRLTNSVEGQKFPSYLMPMNQVAGIQITLQSHFIRVPLRNHLHLKGYLEKLETIPNLFDDVRSHLAKGIEVKVLLPKSAILGVPEQLEALTEKNPKKNPITKRLYSEIRGLSETQVSDARKKASTILRNKIIPAVKEFKQFFVQQYLPKTRSSYGIFELKDGQEWYAYSAKKHTTTDLSPEEIHQIGLKEVARLTDLMDQVRKDVGFKGDLSKFKKHLLTDKKFKFTSADEMLQMYRAASKELDGALVGLFEDLPKMPYGVIALPPSQAKSAPAAFYSRGSLVSGTPANFLLNTDAATSRPTWNLMALTLHEAVPGHHLQISLAQELENVPKFRRFGGETAFVEGWGLYAEELGFEMGVLNDPYHKFGKYNFEIWRAIRLVVDTGIHYKGWSREKAIRYMKDKSALLEKNIVNEVDRYISWPGQALAYKIGELKIKELRKLCEKTLGDRFDVRKFHKVVLGSGPLPLQILEEQVMNWLGEQKTSS